MQVDGPNTQTWNGNCPAILYLQDYKEKQEILKNAKKFKGTQVFIHSDYSRCTLCRHNLLWDSAKIDAANGKKPYLLHDWVNDDTFIWDDSGNSRVKVPTTAYPSLSTTFQPPENA